MPRVAADGVSLAVHEWPGTGPYTVLLGKNPRVKLALQAFLKRA